VVWGVRDANDRAQRFYGGLGARDVKVRIFELQQPELSRLAAEAPPDGPESPEPPTHN
jgi:hypothetical protein